MEENQTLWSIVLDHWSQILVLLGGIGYAIKSISDFRLKQREISFSKIQEYRILEIKEFYSSYLTLRMSLESFINQTEFGEHKYEVFREICVQINESITIFELKCTALKLFIDKSEIETVDELFQVCISIRNDMLKWHGSRNNQNLSTKSTDLNEIREERLKVILPRLIKKLELSLRKNYNIG